MFFEKSQYKNMLEVCIEKYGEEMGRRVYDVSESHFKVFLDEADYRGSEVVKGYMQNNIFPMLAYYMALLDLNFEQEIAYSHVHDEIQKYARLAKKNNQKLGQADNAYGIFQAEVKGMLSAGFPAEGWDKEWIEIDSNAVHFNMNTCLHHEVVSKYGHPEICQAFCDFDTTAFSGYMPGIRFERAGTIGSGQDVCDFHFYKNLDGNE